MFGKKSGGERVVAVADIGSGSAALALVSMVPESPGKILFASRAVLPYENRSDDAAVKAIIANLDTAAQKVLAEYTASVEGKSPIVGAYAIIRAPWTHSKTLRAESKLEAQSKITEKMIGELAQQALAQDKEFDRQNLLEASVIRVELNGYATGTPIGKVAHTVSVAALMSECDQGIQAGVTEILRKIAPQATPMLLSGTRALLSLTQELPSIAPEYVIVDTSGEGTSIVCVRDGLAESYAVIPEGMRAILTRFSEKGLPEETLSLMRMLERDECNTEACKSLIDSIGRVEPDLARVFGDAMIKIASPRRLPVQMILLAQADFAPWLSRFFSRIDFTQFTQASQPFSVYPLSRKDFERFVSDSKALADTQLSIACALVNSKIND